MDGSFSTDLPFERISELFNISTYIVSQVNPHFIPLISNDISHHEETRLRNILLNALK